MEWMQIVFVILAGVMLWFVYRSVKKNPQAFSKKSFGKTAYTLGLLALGLIVFIGVLIILLRA